MIEYIYLVVPEKAVFPRACLINKAIALKGIQAFSDISGNTLQSKGGLSYEA